MPADKQILKISDEELVLDIVKNNKTHLFETLYDRYSNLIYHKCLSFVKSKSEAQDLTHDIFVKLFISLRTFNGNSKFSTWLYSITYNHCVNHLTRNKQIRNIQNEVDLAVLADTVNDEVSDEELFSISANKLNLALEKIDVNEKVILMMKYQDDLSIKDIMKILEIGESAVKMRLQRAKLSLRDAYKR